MGSDDERVRVDHALYRDIDGDLCERRSVDWVVVYDQKLMYWRHGLPPVVEFHAEPWPWKEHGIHVTHIVPPGQGWPIACYCRICKATEFLLVPWAVKPEDGDYFRMNDMCVRDGCRYEHGLKMALERYPLADEPVWLSKESNDGH